MKNQRSKKRELNNEEEQRISKRQKTGATSVKNSIFCPEVGGKLHNCSTMNLDHELRRMAPALSEHGRLRLPTSKSDLLTCIEVTCSNPPPSRYDVKLIDGPAIIHSLSTSSVSTFDQYFSDVFLPWTTNILSNCDRIDIVWDVYKPSSLKESTRQKRGKGIRRKVSGQAKLPSNFLDFT